MILAASVPFRFLIRQFVSLPFLAPALPPFMLSPSSPLQVRFSFLPLWGLSSSSGAFLVVRSFSLGVSPLSAPRFFRCCLLAPFFFCVGLSSSLIPLAVCSPRGLFFGAGPSLGVVRRLPRVPGVSCVRPSAPRSVPSCSRAPFLLFSRALPPAPLSGASPFGWQVSSLACSWLMPPGLPGCAAGFPLARYFFPFHSLSLLDALTSPVLLVAAKSFLRPIPAPCCCCTLALRWCGYYLSTSFCVAETYDQLPCCVFRLSSILFSGMRLAAPCVPQYSAPLLLHCVLFGRVRAACHPRCPFCQFLPSLLFLLVLVCF